MKILEIGNKMKTKFNFKKNGYALYTAIIVTALFLIISYSVVNLSVRQLALSTLGSESHIAFYNADSGLECAMFWDIKNGFISSFSTTTSSSISCNGQNITTGSQTVSTNPTQSSRIGGGGSSNPTSIFQVNLTKGCAIVSVTKNTNGTTLIESRGYNLCSGNDRYERGIRVQY
jgi:Tfp pilus assembly protein PilX